MIPRCQNVLRRSSTSCRFFSTQDTSDTTRDYLPNDAKVVICGGGVMGASVAYHLGKLGWGPETVVVEQNRYGNTANFYWYFDMKCF